MKPNADKQAPCEYTDHAGYVFSQRDDGLWDVSSAGWHFKPISQEKLPSDLRERNPIVSKMSNVENDPFYQSQSITILGHGSMQQYCAILNMKPGTVIKVGPETYIKRNDGDWDKYDDRLGRKILKPKFSTDVSSHLSCRSPVFIYEPISQHQLSNLFCDLISTRDTDQIREAGTRMIDHMSVGTVLSDTMGLRFTKQYDGLWKVEPEYDEVWFGSSEDIVYQMTESQRIDNPEYAIESIVCHEPEKHTHEETPQKKKSVPER